MKLRMLQIAVEVKENEEIVISQERRDASETANITITMEQVDYLHDLLQRARKEIEEKRQSQEGQEENIDQGFAGKRRR